MSSSRAVLKLLPHLSAVLALEYDAAYARSVRSSGVAQGQRQDIPQIAFLQQRRRCQSGDCLRGCSHVHATHDSAARTRKHGRAEHGRGEASPTVEVQRQGGLLGARCGADLHPKRPGGGGLPRRLHVPRLEGSTMEREWEELADRRPQAAEVAFELVQRELRAQLQRRRTDPESLPLLLREKPHEDMH
eukprot:CAMPEP_0204056750 /NCGR_PEP_ID=MMETSP0360-20130528/132912_1 /ASSEMBLY_ACC=CAM_ASM_000342 /TAXON_ID=268821 /ORGANISM="Scrippsiella Hangoei, Strain SHTV-5" /LENGTH=188 /DNA_ID=CAMNT_0051004189 /DNA_START=137 /DNA_END=703 /DNA_ORIENTATION=-